VCYSAVRNMILVFAFNYFECLSSEIHNVFSFVNISRKFETLCALCKSPFTYTKFSVEVAVCWISNCCPL
jgi:hypothetical protein